jgi:hypothetical protein
MEEAEGRAGMEEVDGSCMGEEEDDERNSERSSAGPNTTSSSSVWFAKSFSSMFAVSISELRYCFWHGMFRMNGCCSNAVSILHEEEEETLQWMLYLKQF